MPQQSCLDADLAAALRLIEDPEIGVNIVDLGLVYEACRDASGIRVRMTATSRSCPLGEFMVEEARAQLAAAFPSTEDIDVEIVWSPAWEPSRMTKAARAQLSLGAFI